MMTGTFSGRKLVTIAGKFLFIFFLDYRFDC